MNSLRRYVYVICASRKKVPRGDPNTSGAKESLVSRLNCERGAGARAYLKANKPSTFSDWLPTDNPRDVSQPQKFVDVPSSRICSMLSKPGAAKGPNRIPEFSRVCWMSLTSWLKGASEGCDVIKSAMCSSRSTGNDSASLPS